MLYVVPLDRSAGDDLIKAVRVTPGRPLTFGAWRELPIIAVGPRGGKIVGYRRGHLPIYAGSRRAQALAHNAAAVERVSKKHVPDQISEGEVNEYKTLVTDWLVDVQGLKLPHGNTPTIYISQSPDLPGGKHRISLGNVSGQLVASLGFTMALVPNQTVYDYQFVLEDLLAAMKASPAPAPPPQEQAVVAAETASGQVEKDPFPDLSKLKEIEAGKAAGSHGNKLFVDPKGEKWLFKPTDPIIARAEVAATQIGRFLLPGERIQAGKMVEIKGQEGVLLSWLKGKLIPQSDHSHPGLDLFKDKANFAQFVQHHVIDWLISNHDGHAGNWLYRDDPDSPGDPMKDICGIDKGQSWRFFGKDKLSVNYSPNHSVPIYNKVWKAWADGSIPGITEEEVVSLLSNAVGYTQHKLTADQMAAIVGPYALARAAKEGIDAAALIKQMQGRLANLRTDFEQFLTDLTGHAVKLDSPPSKKAPQEPAKAPAPTPKAPPAPIAKPGPAQAAPAKEKAPTEAGKYLAKPLIKGNFTVFAKGTAPAAGISWPKGYPGPGFELGVTYKGKFYKVTFEQGGKGPVVFVTYPDKTTKSFSSPNAAGDSLYLWHNKLDLDMTATEKKAKKMGASAKVTLGINKFTPEELGIGAPGAASAPPSVLEDQGVVPPGAETVSLGTLLSQEIGAHGLVTKPELLPQAVKDFVAAHGNDKSGQGTVPALSLGKVYAFLGDTHGMSGEGSTWWMAVPCVRSNGMWGYQLFELTDTGQVESNTDWGTLSFQEDILGKDITSAWKPEPPPGEKHQDAPSPDNWETMPDEDATIGWKGIDPKADIIPLGTGTTIHWMAGGVKWSFFHVTGEQWAEYKDGVYLGAVTTESVNDLKATLEPTHVYLGQSEKIPPEPPALQPPATIPVGLPPKPVLPAEAKVPPSTSQFHPGLLVPGTVIKLTKQLKVSPDADATVPVEVTLAAMAKHGYKVEAAASWGHQHNTFLTLTAAALWVQALEQGYPTIDTMIKAQGKPDKMPTWQAFGIQVDQTESAEQVEEELKIVAETDEPPKKVWPQSFLVLEHADHANPEFYNAAPVGSVIRLADAAIPGGSKKEYLKKTGSSEWLWCSGGEPHSYISGNSIPATLAAYEAKSPMAYAGAALDAFGKEVTIPFYAAKVSTISSAGWLDHLMPGSEVWAQFDGFAPKKWTKAPNGEWSAPNGAFEPSPAIHAYVTEKNPDELAIFISGFKTPQSEQSKGPEPAKVIAGFKQGMAQVGEAAPPPLPKVKSGKQAKANKHLTYLPVGEFTLDSTLLVNWKKYISGLTESGKIEKPTGWPAWVPPPGLPVEVKAGDKTVWITAMPVASYGPDKIRFTMFTSAGKHLAAKAYKVGSAGLALKKIFNWAKMKGALASVDAPWDLAGLKKMTGLDKAVFAPGETWKSVMEGSGMSGLSTLDDVAPGKTTENATPAEKKSKVKSSWQKLSILQSKVGPAEKYGAALKIASANKPGLYNVIIDENGSSDVSGEKVKALIKELGLESAIQEPLGQPNQAWGASWYTVSVAGLSEEMVIETDWVTAQSAKQGKPEPDTASQVPLDIPKKPKYDPAKLAAMKAAAAEKAAKAKELHAWAKQYPLVSDTADLLALSHFQKAMKGGTPDFRMWARASGFENILVGSPHEASAKALGDLLEGKATKVDTLLGPMYRVKRADLLKAVGITLDTIKGPDGKTYPAGTTFTSHDQVTTKADALKPLITKFSEHKTDPATYKMAKISGTGQEQKDALAKALIDLGIEVEGLKTGESYTMAPVKIADLGQVHTKEMIHEASIPEQPPPFASAPLPSLALRDADKDRLPADNNRGDFSTAALGSLFLGKFGHKIRIGHAGILKDCQIAVRRVRDKDGGMYYQVSGELLKFDGDESKLQKGEVVFPTASTLKEEGGHHVHHYNPVEDVHVEEGENAGDIKGTTGWVGVTENGTKISVATGNRTVRDNFYIRIPVDKDVETELHNAFGRMGVDADAAMAVPTPDDERLLIKAGVLRAGLGSARWTSEYNQARLGDEKYLDAQIKKHNLQKFLDGARIETVFGGQQTVVLDDLDEITKRVPYALRTVRQLHHTWRNILEGAGWGARKSQIENGMWASGASTSSDWNEGGAIGTLTRGGYASLDGDSWGNIEMYNPSAPVKVIFHPRVFQRADWWGNKSDSFGKPLSGPAGRYARLDSSLSHVHEYAFEGGISMRDVAGIACEDPSDKVKIIAELEKGGLSEVNGIPLDDFVVVGPKKSRSWIAKNLKGLKPGVLP
jgi:hypothetical protein